MSPVCLSRPRMRNLSSWDLFCRVVDNYGDIGVCWRLARQLAQEHGHTVRLWVDDLRAFERLCPAVDTAAAAQRVSGVDIRHWGNDASTAALLAADAHAAPHDVVVEAFACDIPEPMLQRMADAARQGAAPVWINLEYLSAKTGWPRIMRCSRRIHACAGQALLLPRHDTGHGRRAARIAAGRAAAAFEASPGTRSLWHRLGMDDLMQRAPDALRVSLFAYANPALPSLVTQWAASARPVICLVPEGLAATQIAELLGEAAPRAGALDARAPERCRGALPAAGALRRTAVGLRRQLRPRRGFFVRAQWALRPFVWHIYPQSDDAHLAKLDAFLAHYAPPCRRRQPKRSSPSGMPGTRSQPHSTGPRSPPSWRRCATAPPRGNPRCCVWAISRRIWWRSAKNR
ncbi:hypothetical protein CJO94_11665 [Ralstonia solanacearum]|nr:hypothetical protein CJO94_11665 [Ralstonia solanacearum]